MQRKIFRINWAFGAVALIGLTLPLAAQTRYVVTDLGTLGGASASANGINSIGQVTGTSAASSGQNHAYRTLPNQAIRPVGLATPSPDDLGTLGGTFSVGEGINDSGQVSGTSGLPSTVHAFRSSGNGSPVALTDLGTFSGTFSSSGRGINNSGQVTGEANVAFTAACFFIFSNSAFRTGASTVSGGDDLGTLLPNNCRSAEGIGINNFGVVVGESATNLFHGIPNHAFRATGNTMVDIHPVLFLSSTATAINNAGQIVGTVTNNLNNQFCYRTVPGDNITFFRDDLGNLGGLGCNAFGINSFGDVVGASSTGTALHAFLFTNNTMLDLNNLIGATSSAVKLTLATGINDLGQISAGGFVTGDNINSHAFRVEPAGAAVNNFIALLSDPSLGLTAGQISSFTDKLQNALLSIQQGLFKQAINQLNALINQVQSAVKTGNMSAQTGATLIAAANALIASLS